MLQPHSSSLSLPYREYLAEPERQYPLSPIYSSVFSYNSNPYEWRQYSFPFNLSNRKRGMPLRKSRLRYPAILKKNIDDSDFRHFSPVSCK